MSSIAILGATRHLARDFIEHAARAGYELFLYSRRPDAVTVWMTRSAPFIKLWQSA